VGSRSGYREGGSAAELLRLWNHISQDRDSSRIYSETFHLRNQPSRHRKERDNAALLTQEGDLHAFTVSTILCAELIWTAVSGQEGQLFNHDIFKLSHHQTIDGRKYRRSAVIQPLPTRI
jgi:hypothetical protein